MAPLTQRESILCGLALIVPTIVATKFVLDRVLLRRTRGKKAAVILAGCGYLDGSETTEAMAVLVSLAELGFVTTVFAPEGVQYDVVDHQSQKALGYAPRSVLQESARLSRGNVLPLAQLAASEFACLVIPGGFGAAKNLCNWATAASPNECVVRDEVRLALEAFASQKKPIGLCCIAPVLAAVVFKNRQLKLTVGGAGAGEDWPYAGTVQQVQSLGCVHVECQVGQVLVDREHQVVTTPAFMSGTASRFQVFSGVRGMVREVAWLVV